MNVYVLSAQGKSFVLCQTLNFLGSYFFEGKFLESVYIQYFEAGAAIKQCAKRLDVMLI